MTPPLVALKVTVSPVVPPVTDIVGVESNVTLSVLDVPESDAATRSGIDGATGAVLSMFIDNGELAGDTFPAGSVNVADTDHVPSVSAGKSHDVAEPIT